MKLTIKEVDVEALRQDEHGPRVLLPTQLGQPWMIPATSLLLNDKTSWNVSRASEHILVPVVMYRTHTEAPIAALAMAATLGLKAGLYLAENGHRVQEIALVVGNQVEQHHDEATDTHSIAFFMGWAFRVL